MSTLLKEKMLPSLEFTCSCVSQRWVFTILASIAWSIQSLFTVAMSINIIEMVVPTADLKEYDNLSCQSSNNLSLINRTFIVSNDVRDNVANIKRFSWDEYTQGIILSSFFWSCAVIHIIAGPLGERFGGKHFIGFGILGQSILAFLTPFLTNWGGYIALIITRVLTGMVLGAMYPICNMMISKWTTPAQITVIGNFVNAGAVLGFFFGHIVPALIMKHSGTGWPAVFYFLGIVGIIWFLFWQVLVYESPEVHPFISKEELNELKNRVDVEGTVKKLPPAPWKDILLSKTFWAFTVNLMGANWTIHTLLSYLPKYLGNVVKFSFENNGYFSALPYFFMWLNTILSAWISNKILEKQWMNLTNVRKLFATIATMGTGFFLLLASYAECNKILVVIMFMIGITMCGAFYPTMSVNPLDLSPNYAGSVSSAGSGIASIVGALTPYLVGVLTPNSTLTEWRIVFWIVFLSASVCNIVYLAWFEAEIQPWNDVNFVTSEMEFSKVDQEADD